MIDTIPFAGDIFLCTEGIKAAQRSFSQGKPDGCFRSAQTLDILPRRAFTGCVLALNEICETCHYTIWYNVPESIVRSII